jgi:hypothetical protein
MKQLGSNSRPHLGASDPAAVLGIYASASRRAVWVDGDDDDEDRDAARPILSRLSVGNDRTGQNDGDSRQSRSRTRERDRKLPEAVTIAESVSKSQQDSFTEDALA